MTSSIKDGKQIIFVRWTTVEVPTIWKGENCVAAKVLTDRNDEKKEQKIMNGYAGILLIIILILLIIHF